MTLSATPCCREVRQRVGRVHADLLLEQDEGDGGQIRRQHVAVERRIGACEQQDTSTLGGELVGPLAHGVVGRTRRPRPSPAHRDTHVPCPPNVGRAPLASGRERHGAGRAPSRPARRTPRASAVAVALRFVVGRKGAERVVDRRRRRRGPRPRRNSIVPSVSVPVLSRHTTSTRARPSTAGSSCTSTLRRAKRDRRDREREARQQHQAFGHHRHDTGDDPRHRFAPPFVRAELAEREQRRGRNQRPGDVAQDRVDAVHQLGTHEREPPGLGCEPPRVRVGADTCRLEATAAGHHDAAGEHFVARPPCRRDRTRP